MTNKYLHLLLRATTIRQTYELESCVFSAIALLSIGTCFLNYASRPKLDIVRH